MILTFHLGPHRKQMAQKPPVPASAPPIPAPPVLNATIQSPTVAHVPPPVPPPPPPVLFIPDSDLAAWKPYAAVAMKMPAKATDIDTIILHLSSPFRSLQLEGLVNLQKYLTAVHNRRSLVVPASALPQVIAALHNLCRDELLRGGEESIWTFESLIAKEDGRRRDLLADHLAERKDGMLERVSFVLQLMIVTRPE